MYPKFPVSHVCRTLLLAATLASAVPLSQAQTDIASKPIAGVATGDNRPNIMLLMDTSGSMGFSHMPDEVEGVTAALPIGYRSYQCNSIYYNPNSTYGLPVDADGNDLPTPSFDASPYARYNHYSTDATTVNLSTSFQAFDLKTRFNQPADPTDKVAAAPYSDLPQPAYYYVYSGPEKLSYSTAPCTQPDLGLTGQAVSIPTDGGGTWKRVLVSSTSGPAAKPDERQNFANWYTYYRTRMAMTKSSVGLAFRKVTDAYRVGFVTANPLDAKQSVAADKFLAISQFTPDNKRAWYAKVNAQVPAGSSPMREGLARVGRYYANKHDSINVGMDGDPVQYGCQKNYTLMTTDGYWNTAAESLGPVDLDGTKWVGQQDGTLTNDAGLTPYGVWDGGQTSTRVTQTSANLYSRAPCVAYKIKSTVQYRETDRQTTKTTTQVKRQTQQDLQSTSQMMKSTTQTRIATSITKIATARTDATITEIRQSSTPNVAVDTWLEQYTDTVTRTQTQRKMSTFQNLQSTQWVEATATQVLQTKQHTEKSSNQPLATTTQYLQSTTQALQSSSRVTAYTTQVLTTTTQTKQTVTQVSQSTVQTIRYDGATELAAPVAPGTCTSSGAIKCYDVTSGPTPVANCTAAAATSANNYTTTTCSGPVTLSGPTPVLNCVAADPVAANSFQKTTCQATPTTVPSLSCAPIAASSSNNYTATTCPTAVTTASVPVASPCSNVAASSSNNFTSTTCNPAIQTGPTPVQTCSPIAQSSSNSYTTTTCPSNPANTVSVPVQSCTASAATAANNWTATTCGANPTTTKVPVQSCTPQTASAPSWTTITCSANSTPATAVASCTGQTGSASNSWMTITCNVVTDSVEAPVASCTPVSAASGPGFVATLCRTLGPTTNTVPKCVADTGTTAPNFQKVTCATKTTSNVGIPATCVPLDGTASPYVIVTCPAPVSTPQTAVASCTPGTNPTTFVVTSCFDVPVGTGTVMACTPGTDATGLTTICTKVTSAPVNVQPGSCIPGTVGGVTTYCNNRTLTSPVQTCVPNPGTTAPWITRTCPTPVTTVTAVQTCTASGPTSPNWTTVTCSGPITVSGPTAVASCTSGYSATTHQTTTCTPVSTGPTLIDPTLCTPASASSTNNYTTTTCPQTTTGPTGVSPSACTPITATAANGWKTTTCTPNNTGPTAVAVTSCTAAVGTSGNSWVTTTCIPTTTGPTPVPSCTAVAASNKNSYVATTCSTNNTPLTAVASCTNDPVKSSTNSYTATTCVTSPTTTAFVPPGSCNGFTAGTAPDYIDSTCTTTTTGPTLVPSCTTTPASAANSYLEVSCTTDATGPTVVPASSCTAQSATAGNSQVTITCTDIPGEKFQVTTDTSTTTEYISGTNTISQMVDHPTPDTPHDVTGICYTPGYDPAEPLMPTTQPSPPSGCNAWPCVTVTEAAKGGSTNSMADVAQYYYVTDLRPDMKDLVAVASSAPLDDHAPWQHMTTFALGLGVSGTLNFDPNYLTSLTGDFSRIRPPVAVPPATPQQATLNWPAWPDPTISHDANGNYTDPRSYNNAKSIDDFWHTAVNGRGKYFSAGDPAAVVDGLGAALTQIDSANGAGGAAAVTSNTPTQNNNTSFLTSYRTKEWSGNVTAQKVDLVTGAISSTVDWSAQAKLDAITSNACDNRTIYIRSAGAPNNLANFSWNTQACLAGVPTGSPDTGLSGTQQALFGSTAVAKLSQYPSMSTLPSGKFDQRSLAAGANLVNFLRGQRGMEVPVDAFTPDAGTVYRKRAHVLGDIVGSVPAYVAAPARAYSDAGYDTFKTTYAKRTPMIYVGANDGMLHAFYAPIVDTDPNYASAGAEAWAYVPQAVMPELYRLADTDYKTKHHFFVDGSPTTGDVYDTAASAWKTILVGGLNAGGTGFYAMDVTDPANPKSLWEFNRSGACYNASVSGTGGSDCNLGLSFGRPIITKLVDGTWVVLLTSGYNDLTQSAASGDGHGYLYVLNAVTGNIISKIDNGVGDTSNPSGLREVNNYVANGALDNTTLRVYGGDLLGNIWRFDVNDNVPPVGKEATLVGITKDTSGTTQPITTRLQLAEVDGKTMIVAATGQFLGASDTTTTQVQSVYGFTDLVGAAVAYPDLRGSLRTITYSQTATTRTATCSGGATNCAQTSGWVVDMPESGERVNVDPIISGESLVYVSNVPSNSACEAGGHSWLNFVNLLTGTAVESSVDEVVSRYMYDSLSVGLTVIALPDGTTKAIGVAADATDKITELPPDLLKPQGHRVSWREIKR